MARRTASCPTPPGGFARVAAGEKIKRRRGGLCPSDNRRESREGSIAFDLLRREDASYSRPAALHTESDERTACVWKKMAGLKLHIE
ncbi:hypothetical protein EYF80_043214 [Liparis tanakae]|uniref:Uncharacterized protein n=1 Tax=Liparis tanakae TaxID=230148 RepID=A0A4Z2G0F5_9TELE|nr:hypothetical protein EYF80_043214 [Liparis tanakae]